MQEIINLMKAVAEQAYRDVEMLNPRGAYKSHKYYFSALAFFRSRDFDTYAETLGFDAEKARRVIDDMRLRRAIEWIRETPAAMSQLDAMTRDNVIRLWEGRKTCQSMSVHVSK